MSFPIYKSSIRYVKVGQEWVYSVRFEALLIGFGWVDGHSDAGGSMKDR